jgi:hypothetical protein
MFPMTPRGAAPVFVAAARVASVALAALGLGACSPALDWRELKTADGHVAFLLPCKPTVQERAVQLADRAVKLALQACAAQGQTWGVATADLADPAAVGPALAELARSAAANVQGQIGSDRAARVPGATPNDGNRQLVLSGRQPGGQPVAMQLVVFAHGTRVVQATVLGAQVGAEAADTFFGGLRVVQP